MRAHQTPVEVHGNPYHWVDTSAPIASAREMYADAEVLYDATTERVAVATSRVPLWRYAVLVLITGYTAFALIALVARQ